MYQFISDHFLSLHQRFQRHFIIDFTYIHICVQLHAVKYNFSIFKEFMFNCIIVIDPFGRHTAILPSIIQLSNILSTFLFYFSTSFWGFPSMATAAQNVHRRRYSTGRQPKRNGRKIERQTSMRKKNGSVLLSSIEWDYVNVFRKCFIRFTALLAMTSIPFGYFFYFLSILVILVIVHLSDSKLNQYRLHVVQRKRNCIVPHIIESIQHKKTSAFIVRSVRFRGKIMGPAVLKKAVRGELVSYVF